MRSTFGTGGTYAHIPWEVSMEIENQFRRARRIPKDRKEMILSDEKLEALQDHLVVRPPVSFFTIVHGFAGLNQLVPGTHGSTRF